MWKTRGSDQRVSKSRHTCNSHGLICGAKSGWLTTQPAHRIENGANDEGEAEGG